MPFDGIPEIYVRSPAKSRAVAKMDEVIDLIGDPARWCKGLYQTQDDRFCVVGAVRFVDGESLLREPILKTIRDARFTRIEGFNDHPDTTHADVVAMLLKTRARLEAQPVGALERLSRLIGL